MVSTRYRVRVTYTDGTTDDFVGYLGALNSDVLNAWDKDRYWAVATSADGYSYKTVNMDHALVIDFDLIEDPKSEDAGP